jgi:hypothetical protein
VRTAHADWPAFAPLLLDVAHYENSQFPTTEATQNMEYLIEVHQVALKHAHFFGALVF